MTTPVAPITSVRFFTSAALRQHEEVPGEAVQWLPRAITVEYEDGEPVTGVWRSARGERRVCWYGLRVTPELVSAHDERFGDEAFWVIDRSGLHEHRVAVLECDGSGRVERVRAWDFDEAHMPSREVERDAAGRIASTRTYDCVSHGVVVAKTEQLPGKAAVTLPRPHRFPIGELAGEPYPCGGTIGLRGPRIIETIQQNQSQGRYIVIHQDGVTWRRGLATVATSKGWKPEVHPILDFADESVAARVCEGELLDPRNDGYRALGVVEALPAGRDLDVVVQQAPLPLAVAVQLALDVAAVAGRAHARGHRLGGIRPELIFVRSDAGTVRMTQIAHRGPAVISQYYGGEAILIPSVYAADFSSSDDATGLAQLVWYMLTGGHPFLAAENLRWDASWQHFRHKLRTRQPWTGPAALGPLLERALFADTPMDFDVLVAELEKHRGAVAPYR